MRSKSIFSFTVVAMTFVILLFSCSREIDSSIETNDFIQRFLDINSVRLYKSEIKRVKVNYFPASTMIHFFEVDHLIFITLKTYNYLIVCL